MNFSLWRGGEHVDFSSKTVLSTLVLIGPVPINLHNVRELISHKTVEPAVTG